MAGGAAGRQGYLYGISAVSPNDIWAVGIRAGRGGPLVEHWDGIAWTEVPTPHVKNNLKAVDAISTDDVWAVGERDHRGYREFLAEHWDGVQWAVIPTPHTKDVFMNSVAAAASDDVWAVGVDYTLNVDGVTLIEHWDGTSWTVVPSPNVGKRYNELTGVAAVSADDVWAVGNYVPWTYGGGTMALHWDGRRWSVASKSPVNPNKARVLSGVTVASPTEIWAAGYVNTFFSGPLTLTQRICPVDVTDSGFSPSSSMVAQGQTAAWHFDGSNTDAHKVTDASGMGLFDSGSRSPGGSFTHRFFAAGLYPFEDLTGSTTGSIAVPVRIFPHPALRVPPTG